MVVTKGVRGWAGKEPRAFAGSHLYKYRQIFPHSREYFYIL
jgi:hypothetical protein